MVLFYFHLEQKDIDSWTPMHKMMAQNCGKKDDYFMKIVDKKKHADWFLDAGETKKHGLANHLRVPKLSIRVEVDIDFE